MRARQTHDHPVLAVFRGIGDRVDDARVARGDRGGRERVQSLDHVARAKGSPGVEPDVVPQLDLERQRVQPAPPSGQIGARLERVGVQSHETCVHEARRAQPHGVHGVSRVEGLGIVCHEHLDGPSSVGGSVWRARGARCV